MQTNIDISKAFMDSPDGVLSIHQLSQKLKLPYGTTYNRIHLLNQQKIVQILPQGKAKLCALNAENPMTADLLALGAAQTTEQFSDSLADGGKLFKRIVKLLKTKVKGKISSAILISPDSLKALCKESAQENMIVSPENSSAENKPEIIQDFQSTIDFFFIKSDEQFDESILESEITAMLPSKKNIAVTSMVVDKETMLGMLSEEENEAGLAAYTMLHEGIIVYGYESFYEIILEAFTKKLSVLG